MLTDKKEEIDALLADVESQWVGTIRKVPTDEISYDIEFSNDKSGGVDLVFTYFPKSDALLFYSSYDFPNPIISLKSSDVLKELLKHCLSLDQRVMGPSQEDLLCWKC